jgi:hypothetical protein
LRSIILTAAVLALTGCATIFTGSSQKITIDTAPQRSVVVVVGSPAAPVLLSLKRSSDISQKVVSILSPFISERAGERLRGLALEELVTRMAAWARLGIVPDYLEGAALPAAVQGRLLSVLGIEHVAVSPTTVKLKKGRKYAVLAWQEGHQARLVGIGMKFNFVTLVNVFNLFLGVPIDMLTGAWYNLGPKQLQLVLPVRTAAVL